MAKAVRLLMVEDVAADAELAVRALKRAGLQARRKVVDTEEAFLRAIEEFEPQLILSDFGLPKFDGMRALEIARERAPDTPFIFVSGTIGEGYAIRALKNGATDYVLKTNLIRLPVAVERALREARYAAAIRDAQRALAESEAGLRRAQAMAGLAHVVSAKDGAFEGQSETLPRMLGLAPAAMPRGTREWLALVHPEDRAHFRDKMIEAGRTGMRVEMEYRIRHADGSWIQIQQVSEPMEGKSGAPDTGRWFGTLLDVTGRKQAEAAFAASEARYRSTFEQAAVGIVHTTVGGEVGLVNENFCAMTGYARVEAIQKNIRELVHPEDLPACLEGRAKMLAGSPDPYQRELRLARKDGSYLWVNVTTSLVGGAGSRPQHFVSVLNDVSERRRMEQSVREAESRYRSIFENSTEGIFQSTPEGRMIDCNPANARFLGYDSPQELMAAVTDAGVQLYVNPEDRRRLMELVRKDGSVHGFEVAIRRKDGATVWSAISARAVRDSSGAISHILGMQQDITSRVEAERDSQRFRAAMDITVDSIYLTDPETMRFLYVNETACRRLGYPREQLMQKDSHELIGKSREEVRLEYDAVIRAGDRGMRSESRFVRKDGTEGWTELHRRALRLDSRPVIVTIARDITERRRGEEELRRFRLAMDSSADLIFIIDRATMRNIDVNETACRLLGYTKKELLGMGPAEILPFSRAELERGYDALITSPSLRGRLRSYYRCKDGSQLPFESTRQVLRSGDSWLVVAVARDTREQIASENALRDSEARKGAILEASLDAIVGMDHEGRIVEFNAAAERCFGYTRSQVVGAIMADLIVPPELRERHREGLQRYLATGEARILGRRLELPALRADGSRFDAELTVSLIPGSKPPAFTGTVRDITERKRAELALAESEQRFRSLTGLSSDFYWETDAEHRMQRVSHGSEHRPVLGTGQIGKRRWESPSTRPDGAGWAAHRSTLDARQPFRDFEIARVDPKGFERWLSISGEPVFDDAGAFKGYRGVGKDITESKAQQRRIERLSRVYAVLSGINAAIVRIRDRGELYHDVCRIVVEAGKFPKAWIGELEPDAGRVRMVAWRGADEGFFDALQRAVGENMPQGRGVVARAIAERRTVISNDIEHDPEVMGRTVALATGSRSLAVLPLVSADKAIGVLVLHAEVTGFFDDEEMKLLNELAGDVSFALDGIAREEKLNYLALHDALTGLANRALLVERLGQTIHGAGQAGAKFAIAWFDVERFTTINESLGRQAGDALIRQVGERLAHAAGAAAVARIAADHFVALLPPVKGRSEAGRVFANLARACFAEPYLLQGAELRVAAKAGLALFPNDGTDADTLLGNAEAALRRAKETGERHVFYTPDLTERTGVTLTLENKLRRALEKDEFVLYYQPKVEVETRQIVGMEALIRWQSPELGLVPPGKFIPLMEETGMILDVGTWALRRASLDHARWTELMLKPPRVAVNVSAIQLRQKEFVSAVEQAIMEGVAPTGIDLEITESLIMEDIEGNIGKLRDVRGLGVGLAIDDFGTGYSSLSYLAKLPVQTLKIDRSFVITMLNEPDTMTLVQTIISLAHSLRLKVVAEGVDAEEQAKVLRLLRCDQMQGFLFSKPVPFDELTGLLKGARG